MVLSFLLCYTLSTLKAVIIGAFCCQIKDGENMGKLDYQCTKLSYLNQDEEFRTQFSLYKTFAFEIINGSILVRIGLISKLYS